MKVLPYILYRTTNRSYDELYSLNLTETINLLQQYNSDLAQFQSEVNLFTETLFSLINACQNDNERKIFINVKRDIHNHRSLRQAEVSKIQNGNNSSLHNLLESYTRKKRNLDDSLEKISGLYINETEDVRKQLISLSAEEIFKQGIVLSSADIFHSLNNYIKNEKKLSSKKQYQVENGLIKYLSRFYAKTSPFSTFTSIGLLKLNAAGEKYVPLEYPAKSSALKSFVSVNNNIYLLFKSHLVNHETLKYKIPLKLNPTLVIENGKYVFLTNNYFNVESIQRIRLNPFMNAIVACFEKSKDASTNTIVQVLHERDEFDNTEQEIREYIWHLVNTGFFELDLKTSGLDPNWIISLKHFLCNYLKEDNSSVKELSELIDLLIEGSKEIEKAGSADRFIIIDRIYNALSKIFKLSEKKEVRSASKVLAGQSEEAGPMSDDHPEKSFLLKYDLPIDISPEKIFFEDTLTSKNYSLSGSFINDTCSKLKELFEHLWIFEPNNEERQVTSDFFIKTYSEEAVVPALKFYEDFYAFYLRDKPAEEKKTSKAGSYWSALSRKWTQAFYDYVTADRLLNKDNVCFNLEDLITVNRNVELEVNKKYNTSIGAFIQVFTGENKTESCVLNAVFCGFGKLFSRFLYVLDTDLMSSIREHIKNTLPADILTCETADTSVMNANMHPAIMDYEITMPFGNSILPEEKRIPISRVLIKYDKDTHELKLMDSITKKIIYVYYLGFQSFDYRSKLFQMLIPFSNFKQPLIYTFTEMVNTKFDKVNNITDDAPIKIKPRITYEDTIVIQRKTIIVSQAKLPPGNSNLNDPDYFIFVQKWQQELNLPSMVFVRIMLPKDDTRHLFGDHDRKPQFIDFRNAFLVKRFEKICSKAKNGLEITEMLPSYEHLLSDNDEKFVTEFLVEYYS